MATAKPRARKPKESKTASALLEQLKFVSVAQHSQGNEWQTHCNISNGTVVAFDGGMTVGILTDEQLNCCPQTGLLIKALEKCHDGVSITMLDNGRLSIKSGKFKATVPCVDGGLYAPEPDPPIATLTDAIKTALGACIPIAQDGQAQAWKSGILLQANTAIASNGFVMVEAWHGVDLPPGLLLPRPAALAITKCAKPLTQFGFSSNSATFYFEDNSFIKTSLFENDAPDFAKIINVETNPWPLPGGFFEALDHIAAFVGDDNRVYFKANSLSAGNDIAAASYEVPGIKEGLDFNIEYLKLIRPYMANVDFSKDADRRAFFFNSDNTVRGIIMGIAVPKPKTETVYVAVNRKMEMPKRVLTGFDDMDDDIPF